MSQATASSTLEPTPTTSGTTGRMTVRGASFIGIGSMVGAGIFALLGEAGAYAGSALWISFLIAGTIAALQGYSFALFGARYPSSGGLMEYYARGFGNGHLTGIAGWLIFAVNGIVTALVATSFGNYATALFFGDSTNQASVKLFAIAVVVVLTAVNTGKTAVIERAQSAIVVPLIIVMTGFAVLSLWQIDPAMLAPSTYPPARDIFSSVGLTFFSFLGFAIVSFTAGQLAEPRKELPKAMFIALGFATALYVAISLGVFGTLTVDEVVASGGTALAKAAEPILGQAGYVLMTVAALLATTSCTNAGLYPANGLCTDLAAKGQFPPFLARPVRNGTVGLFVAAGLILVLTVVFDLSAIANLGSATALLGFLLVSIAHLRVVDETGARRWLIILGGLVTAATFVYFTATTIIGDPVTMTALLVFIILAIVLDAVWKRRRDARQAPAQ